MKKTSTTTMVIAMAMIAAIIVHSRNSKKIGDYPIQQVKLSSVELTDSFWLPKIRTIQDKTIRYAFGKCESEGRLENFKTAGDVIRGGTGKTRGAMPFDDTDVYKTIEGAAYSLISAPNPDLDRYLDSIIGIIAYGQEPDGYLTTWRTIDPTHPTASWVKTNGERWDGLSMSHELYNSGHLFEAASAHYWATGKRNFLDIAVKNADLLVKVFGDTTRYEVPGHQIVETGLIKLYQITDTKDYLHLAKRFLDLRGDTLHRHIRGAYSQDHLPVTQQDEVVGHAVRAVYMYAAMTDIAALYKDTAYFSAAKNLWDNMTGKKMYLTGGLGARHAGEAFGDSYELPNLTAYSETCAAIGGVYWADRMFRLTGDASYLDLAERMLYNGVIAGISLEGTDFFYPNPLESDGTYGFNQGTCTRQPWFDCSCCPTNLIRFIPSIPNLIYATQKDTVFVNLFVSSKAEVALGKQTVKVEQTTNYPWNGGVKIRVSTEKSRPLTLKIRVPLWAQNKIAQGDLYSYCDEPIASYKVLLNGDEADRTLKNGFVEITRSWTSNDSVELLLPWEARRIVADNRVADNRNKYAVAYGALVYCAEEVDNPTAFGSSKESNSPASFVVEWQPDLLNGVNLIHEKSGDSEYKLIPYYAWSNRGVGKMKVWKDLRSEASQQ
jgi:DUF1680 family protein